MEEKSIIIALDVGTGKIGVAMSDPLRIGANPVAVIARDGNEFEEIKKIVESHNADTIIVGFPKTLRGEVGRQAEKVLEFTNTLRTYLNNKEIILWDERFTSVIAHRMFKALGIRSKRERLIKDAAEAILILQSYLNYIRRKRKSGDSGG